MAEYDPTRIVNVLAFQSLVVDALRELASIKRTMAHQDNEPLLEEDGRSLDHLADSRSPQQTGG